MALTEAQIETTFEVLELPRATTVEMPIGDMGVSGQTFSEGNLDYQISTKIESRLSALTSTQQSNLITYLDRWDGIGTCTTVLDGGVGTISGITQAPNDERDLIQRRVRRIVGVYSIIEEVKMQDKANSGNTFIPVIN